MKLNNWPTYHKVRRVGKTLALFITGGLAVHILVMFIDYHLITEPIYLNLHGSFMTSSFSAPMIPMIGVYGLFTLLIFFYWKSTKKAMHFAISKRVEHEKLESVFKSMQRVTGILAEHISTQNAEVLQWIESRRISGHQVSENIEGPSRKIASALHTISEISFVFPYSDKRPEKVEDIEQILRVKLDRISQLEESRKNPSVRGHNIFDCTYTDGNGNQ